jgi:hypothetical protein
VGLAVVPGQGIAGLPGPAGDGVVAYLAAGDRKMGDGHESPSAISADPLPCGGAPSEET